jgi:hypothetical protein
MCSRQASRSDQSHTLQETVNSPLMPHTCTSHRIAQHMHDTCSHTHDMSHSVSQSDRQSANQ